MSAPRVLVVCDKFKDALSASGACAAVVAGLGRAAMPGSIDVCPLTDGGDGFAEILTAAAGGAWRTVTVSGPRGRPIRAGYGRVATNAIPAAARRRLALPADASAIGVVDVAQASGLALLAPAERDPWQTSTLGTGELLAAAASEVNALVLGIGGSATNDLGIGALSALGLRSCAASGAPVTPPVPRRWAEVTHFTGAVPADFPPLRMACDVANPLLGPSGCTAVFGPQKGLKPEDRDSLEAACARMASMLCEHAGQPLSLMDVAGAGAAGGVAFGFMAAANAKLLPGFQLVCDWLDLERRIAAADVVITGEGRFDASSLAGKGPGAVARLALARRKRVHLFAGSVAVAPVDGLAVHAITAPGTPLDEALARTAQNLEQAVARVFGGCR